MSEILDSFGPVITALSIVLGILFTVGFVLVNTDSVDTISDAITRKQIKKLLADPSQSTLNKAISIATFIKGEEECYPRAPLYRINRHLQEVMGNTQEERNNTSSAIRVVISCDGKTKTPTRRSNRKDTSPSSALNVTEACEETRMQFLESCSLIIKLCSPPLRDKLDASSHRTLASLLIRLINLQNSAQNIIDTVFSPLAGLENTKAARETVESCFPNLLALHDECRSILSGLNGVLEVATKAVCAPIAVEKPASKHAKTAFDQVRDAAAKCKTVSVRAKMDKLISQLAVYSDGTPDDTDLANRINSYYLPTLALVLQDLSTAEKKKSKTIEVREALCLKTIETVSNILNSHQEREDSADLINLTAEVEALHNMAALKGDVSSSFELKTNGRA